MNCPLVVLRASRPVPVHVQGVRVKVPPSALTCRMYPEKATLSTTVMSLVEAREQAVQLHRDLPFLIHHGQSPAPT